VGGKNLDLMTENHYAPPCGIRGRIYDPHLLSELIMESMMNKTCFFGIFLCCSNLMFADVVFDNLAVVYDAGGGLGGTVYQADDFTVGGSNIEVAQVTLKLDGFVGESATAFIYGDNSGVPNNSDIRGSLGTVSGFTGINNVFSKIFTPSSPIYLNANTKYWVVVSGSNTDGIGWYYTSGIPLTGTADYNIYSKSVNSGSTWTAENAFSSQFNMKVEGTITTLPVELDFFLVE
jgi:hypothetical protein